MSIMPVAKKKPAARPPGKPVAKLKAGKRPAMPMLLEQPGAVPLVDMSAREAFLKLPLAERRRRLDAFRAALGPALADYSSDDFRTDQRREAERDN